MTKSYHVWTLSYDRLPKELHLPYILTGYRQPYKPWSYYVISLFHVHNELLNIWTHLIGCVLILFQIYYYHGLYSAEGSELRFTVIGFGTCCFITLFNSAIAHLLHSKSSHANYVIFMYDYVGVVCWGFGTAILALYGVSSHKMYEWVHPNYMLVQLLWTYFNFINICFSKLWYGHDLASKARKRMIVGGISLQGLWNFTPWFPRYFDCYYDTGCQLSSLNHITIVCISFIVMTLAFVLHQPERTWPGRFDIIGQSHQIFHVLVIITMCLQFRALYIDHQLKVNIHCKPEVQELLISILLLNIACIFTIYILSGTVKRKLGTKSK
ncbi:response to hormone [Mactra antiquata]